jgi:hypothetical protein
VCACGQLSFGLTAVDVGTQRRQVVGQRFPSGVATALVEIAVDLLGDLAGATALDEGRWGLPADSSYPPARSPCMATQYARQHKTRLLLTQTFGEARRVAWQEAVVAPTAFAFEHRLVTRACR